MKKFFQKTMVATLACLVLVINFGCRPIKADSAQAVTAIQEISERANEISENLMNLKILGALEIGGLTKGGCAFRSVTSILKLGFSVLKLSGVFGPQPNPLALVLEQMNNRFSAIDSKLLEIDGHLTQMEKQINDQLQKIGGDISKIDTTLSKQNITQVASLASKITGDIELFENTVTSNIVDWYDINNNPNYNRKINVTYIVDIDTEETKTVYIPKALMDIVLDYADEWDADNQKELVKNAYKEAIDVAMNTNTYAKTKKDFNEYCRIYYGLESSKGYDDLIDEQKIEILNVFSEAAYDSLRYECMKNIAKARTSSAQTYANYLVEQFTEYCNFLRETDGKYTSPLKSQYNIYSKTHAFQGELKNQFTYTVKNAQGIDETITVDTNDAAIAREKYFKELNQIGTYVAEMAKASGAYTSDDIRNKIILPWSESEAALNEAYNKFYNIDNFGNDIDNYCYITNTVLTYGLNNVEFRMMMNYEKFFKGNVVEKLKVINRERKIVCDWKYSIANEYIASNNELEKLYAYFVGENGQPSGTQFYAYLKQYKVFTYNDDVIKEKSPLIITSFNGGYDFGSGDKINMLAFGFPNTCDKYCDDNDGAYPEAKGFKHANDKTKFYSEIVTSSTPDMEFRRKALANTFNALTGETVTDNVVGAASMYFKWYKDQDDMGMLIDSQYTPTKYLFNDPSRNVKDTAFNYNVDTAYSWPYQWTDSKGKEDSTRINYEIDYLRQYGSIIENSVEVYKVNGKMSRTNSIELDSNNALLANNYVNKVSFSSTYPVVNNMLIDIKDKEDYKAVVNNVNEEQKNFQKKYIELLEELYPGKEAEIAKLKTNKSYSITFDNEKYGKLDMETYKKMISKLIEFLKPDNQGNNANISEMVEKYRDLYSKIIKTVDILNIDNNEIGISLSKDDYFKLTENILQDELGDKLVVCNNVSEIASCDHGKYVYCKENRKVYIWKDNTFVLWDSILEKKDVVLPNDKIAVDDSDIIGYTNADIQEVRDLHAASIIKPENPVEFIKNTNDGKYYQWNDVTLKHSGSYEELTGKNIKTVQLVPTEKETEYIYNSVTNKYYKWTNDEYTEIDNLPKIANISVVNSLPLEQTTKYIFNATDNKYYKWMTNAKYNLLNVTNVQDSVPESYVDFIIKVGNYYYQWHAENIDTDSDTTTTGQYKPINKLESMPGTIVNPYIVVGSNCYKWKSKSGGYVDITNRIGVASDKNTYNGLVAKIGADYYLWTTDETISPDDKGGYVKVYDASELPKTKINDFVVYRGQCYQWKVSEGYIDARESFEDDNIVKVDKISNEYKGLVVKCTKDNKFYYWKENQPIVSGGYTENSDIVSSAGLQDDTTAYIYPHPYDSLKEFKLCYQVKPIISFELYFDKEIQNVADVNDAEIKYNIVPYYDITPMLIWKDANNEQHLLEISNGVLKNTGINSVPIKIPVVQMNDKKDAYALVYHFNNLDETYSPIDEYNLSIKTDNHGNKYVIARVNSFSPFMIKKTYNQRKEYEVPNTGL